MYIGAFDIGGTKTIIALADHTGKIYEKEQFKTDTSDCFRHLERCVQVFQKLSEKLGLTSDSISGVGVNLPGIVDRKTGVLIRAVYAGWENIPVGTYLSEKLKIERILCENDVNACAVGELRFGLGRQYKSFAWFTVSTGVGGAVVCDGRLLRGAHGYAGEFGHLKVAYDSPEQCPCGEEGCLEAHGSGTAITREIMKKLQEESEFKDEFQKVKQESAGAACAVLARNGNRIAQEVYDRAGEYLGRAVSYYVNILDPEAIIIGGGVAASMDLLKPQMKKAIERCTFSEMREIKVLPTALGYEAALMGAIAVAVSDIEGR